MIPTVRAVMYSLLSEAGVLVFSGYCFNRKNIVGLSLHNTVFHF
jgi:hypothetical protein